MSARNYHITITLQPPDGSRIVSAIEVAGPVAHDSQWDPIDECDSTATAALTGGASHDQAQKRKAERKQLIDRIADQLAEHIVAALESRDTINGYKKEAP